MSDATPKAAAAVDAKGNDAVWPFFALYAVMWAGMIGTSLNTDAIKADYSPAVILGFALVLAIVVFFAAARFRRQVLFGFGHSTHVGNLAWHVFIVTGIVFICYLFFLSVVQIEVIPFGASIFDASCATISQRDTAFFVWEAMAKGAFKFFAQYLPAPTEACAPAASWAATITAQFIRWFTALVVVWYVVSFAKAWYQRLRRAKASNPASP
jgi:hypothetical protein